LQRAIAAREAGDSRGAAEYARSALGIDGSSIKLSTKGSLLLTLGNALADLGDFEGSEVALKEAEECFALGKESLQRAQVQIARGRLLAERGLLKEAADFFSELEALTLPKALRSQVLNNLGLLNSSLGNLGESLGFLRKDVQLCEEMGDHRGAAIAHYNLARVCLKDGRRKSSVHHAEIAAEKFQVAGDLPHAREAMVLARTAQEPPADR
jgi:tetratricopeptide (TPR) repeat protein